MRVDIIGAASPDGRSALNRRLALRRANALADYFHRKTSVSDTLYNIISIGEDWDNFKKYLPATLSENDARCVAGVIDKTTDREECEHHLRRLDNGRLWALIADRLFPMLRRAEMHVALRTGRNMHFSIDSTGHSIKNVELENAMTSESIETATVDTIASLPPDGNAKASAAVTPASTSPHWYLKTNIPAWAMLWTNLTAEFDCAPHWSVQLPIYYSGFNYFTSKRKFRTFAIQPEARYWFSGDNLGFFVGAHFGVGWYNVAYGGAVRYQDHDRSTPAIGGGLSAGFRMPFGAAKRWILEFSAGAGIYRLDYDTFENSHNGLRTGRRQRTFYGLDNAAVSIGYIFDLKKGGSR